MAVSNPFLGTSFYTLCHTYGEFDYNRNIGIVQPALILFIQMTYQKHLMMQSLRPQDRRSTLVAEQ